MFHPTWKVVHGACDPMVPSSVVHPANEYDEATLAWMITPAAGANVKLCPFANVATGPLELMNDIVDVEPEGMYTETVSVLNVTTVSLPAHFMLQCSCHHGWVGFETVPHPVDPRHEFPPDVNSVK